MVILTPRYTLSALYIIVFWGEIYIEINEVVVCFCGRRAQRPYLAARRVDLTPHNETHHILAGFTRPAA